MTEVVERTIGDLTVRIDRSICVGFGHCVDEAPDAFVVADDGFVEFLTPEEASRDVLVAACEICPVEALRLIDVDGHQIAP